MAGLLSFPSQAVGLMGRTRNQQLPPEILAWMQGQQVPQGPIMADAADEAMYARNPNGSAGLQALPASVQAAPDTAIAAPVAPAQRSRVSGWNVLGRVLAPSTFGAIDAERARLQAEADRPQGLAVAQENERIARAIGPQALLAMRLNPEEAGKGFVQRYVPQVVGAGAAQAIDGLRSVEQPSFTESGDTVLGRTSSGITPMYTRTTPSITEQSAQNRLAWDREYGQTNLGIAQQNANTTRMNAERPQAVTTATGAVTSLIGNDGSVQGRIEGRASPVAGAGNPQQAQAAIDSNLAMVGNTRAAINRARGQTGFFSTGALTAGLPFNQSRANLESTLDTIKGNLSFTELAKMRQNSPTGGALGSIAVRELDLLGSTVASLDAVQSQEELERSLDIIDASMARYEAALNEARRTGQAPAQAATAGGGPIATNPQTGQSVQWNGSAWVPI